MLHKIGVTKGSVQQRIANAENEPTYLLAPVKVVAEFEIYRSVRDSCGLTVGWPFGAPPDVVVAT